MEYHAELRTEGARTLVSFPDCPGCVTFGRSRSAAIANAREALAGWLEAHLVQGDAPPEPTDMGAKARRKDIVAIPVDTVLAVRLQLRWARQRQGLTQSGLARLVGVSRQQIALLESPDSNVTLRTLERVAGAMKLRLEISLTSEPAAA